MRKLLVLLSLVATQAFAEASFDQIEMLIQQKNYAAAESGLEGIIQNHPKSAKAFYAMAQAQAGLGNLEKAQKALNIATGLNPTLDFAPEGSVRKLKEAITPQVANIEAVEETHYMRNFMIMLTLAVVGFAGWFGYKQVQAKREEEEAEREKLRKEAETANEKRLRDVMNQNIQKTKEKPAKASIATEPADNTPKYTASPAYSNPAPQPTYTPQPTHTTVVNNSSNDLLTGVILGNMMGSHHDHHETTRVVEREVIREVPAKSSRDSSWDTPSSSSSSRDSSWDDTPSKSSRSSSWDSDSSSSSSSSSWSSSSSDSSSSWSSSDSSSSSSWD